MEDKTKYFLVPVSKGEIAGAVVIVLLVVFIAFFEGYRVGARL